MAEILLKNLTKKFGSVTAVKDLDLSIEAKEFTTLLGPSGCGKSTTLRMIAGLERPTTGEIWIKDECVYSKEKNIYVPPGKRKLGMVFQSYALWPHLTVFDNIAFGLQINNKPNIKEKTKKVADILAIGNLLERYPNELSGGQQQRVAIARVLVMDYDILLLDEPLSNLDAQLRMDMRAELKRLHNELNSTIIYVTHDQLEALTMSSNIAVMNSGILQQYASPMDVYDSPSNLFTAKFIGNPPINLFVGKIKYKDQNQAILLSERLEIEFEPTRLKGFQEGSEITMGLRPEDIEIIPLAEAEDYDYQGEIYSVLPAGSEWYFKVSWEDKIITVSEYSGMNLKQDDPVAIKIDSANIKLFDEKRVAIY
jgi:multiple sugar transport system ATP-binding protein